MSDTSTAVTSAAFDNVTEFHRQGVSIFYTYTHTHTQCGINTFLQRWQQVEWRTGRQKGGGGTKRDKILRINDTLDRLCGMSCNWKKAYLVRLSKLNFHFSENGNLDFFFIPLPFISSGERKRYSVKDNNKMWWRMRNK